MFAVLRQVGIALFLAIFLVVGQRFWFEC